MTTWDPEAYAAFKEYLNLGAERSIGAVGSKVGKNVKLIGRWCSRWNWVNRVKAWDLKMMREAEAAATNALQDNADVWARRETEYREREWQAAHALLSKAEQMAKLPIVQQSKTTEDVRDEGGKLIKVINHITVNPVRWDFGTMAGMFAAGDKLLRMSLGLETDRVKNDGQPTTVVVPAQQPAQVVIVLPDNGRRAQGAIVDVPAAKTGPETAGVPAASHLNGQNGASIAPEAPKPASKPPSVPPHDKWMLPKPQ